LPRSQSWQAHVPSPSSSFPQSLQSTAIVVGRDKHRNGRSNEEKQQLAFHLEEVVAMEESKEKQVHVVAFFFCFHLLFQQAVTSLLCWQHEEKFFATPQQQRLQQHLCTQVEDQ
jgi:predicted NACHT family NTPase